MHQQKYKQQFNQKRNLFSGDFVYSTVTYPGKTGNVYLCSGYILDVVYYRETKSRLYKICVTSIATPHILEKNSPVQIAGLFSLLGRKIFRLEDQIHSQIPEWCLKKINSWQELHGHKQHRILSSFFSSDHPAIISLHSKGLG